MLVGDALRAMIGRTFTLCIKPGPACDLSNYAKDLGGQLTGRTVAGQLVRRRGDRTGP